MTTYAIPEQCRKCKHLYKPEMIISGTKVGCLAFPGGIPVDIWEGNFDHTKEHKDDGGVTFEELQR